MNIEHLRVLAYAIGCVSVVSGPAHAQEARQRTGLVLEEVIVTAQKRSESLQDVPVAVSVFTDKTRELVGIATVQDFTDFTPGVTYNVATDRMFIRGIGRYTNNLGTSPGVANYSDGLYNGSNHTASGSSMFNERVEVLRGPQGTLYGRNSIGGALNVLVKRPTDTFQGEVRTTIASYGKRDLEALLRGPINDSMGFLIGGGRYTQAEGFIDNIAGEDEDGKRNDDYATAQLALKFGAAADVWLKYAYSSWDQGWGSLTNNSPYVTNLATCTPTPPATTCASLLPPNSLGPSALFNTGTYTGPGGAVLPLNPANPQYLTPNPGVRNLRQTNHNFPHHERLEPSHQFLVEATGHLGFADLKYVGGYVESRYTLWQDTDNSDRTSYTYTPPGGVNPVEIFTDIRTTYVENHSYFSNELNLISNGDGPLQWVAGAYYFHDNYTQPVFVSSVGQAQIGSPFFLTGFGASGPVYTAAPANPNRATSSTDYHFTNASLAGFGQVDYNFTNTWKGTLGLRYTIDKKYGDEFARYVSYDPASGGSTTRALDISGTVFGPNGGVPVGNGFYTRHLSKEWHATTGTAGIEWSPTDATLAYLKYTRGYKDGGLNVGSIVAQPFTDPEFVNAYELGWKQELGGSFIANASIFYYDYKDSQIPLTLRRAGLPNLTQTFNIDSRIYGLEIESTWRPTDALQVLLNYSYLDTALKDKGCYTDALDGSVIGPRLCATGGHAIDGNPVQSSPRNKVAFNAMYTFQFTPGALTLSTSWTWRDNVYSSIFTRSEWMAPAYDETDLRATWQDAADRYSVIGYMRNAFNDDGYDLVSATSTASGITRSFSLTPPREYGVEAQYRFGK